MLSGRVGACLSFTVSLIAAAVQRAKQRAALVSLYLKTFVILQTQTSVPASSQKQGR